MQYNLAVSSAELDAEMIPGAHIVEDASGCRVLLLVGEQIVGIYPYKNVLRGFAPFPIESHQDKP